MGIGIISILKLALSSSRPVLLCLWSADMPLPQRVKHAGPALIAHRCVLNWCTKSNWVNKSDTWSLQSSAAVVSHAASLIASLRDRSPRRAVEALLSPKKIESVSTLFVSAGCVRTAGGRHHSVSMHYSFNTLTNCLQKTWMYPENHHDNFEITSIKHDKHELVYLFLELSRTALLPSNSYRCPV